MTQIQVEIDETLVQINQFVSDIISQLPVIKKNASILKKINQNPKLKQKCDQYLEDVEF
jgi:hypothetical protein